MGCIRATEKAIDKITNEIEQKIAENFNNIYNSDKPVNELLDFYLESYNYLDKASLEKIKHKIIGDIIC